MVCPYISDGRCVLQIWIVAANIFNRQLWTDNEGVIIQLGYCVGANNPSA
jgi:hypothetical protein